jgi:hypothetical protein
MYGGPFALCGQVNGTPRSTSRAMLKAWVERYLAHLRASTDEPFKAMDQGPQVWWESCCRYPCRGLKGWDGLPGGSAIVGEVAYV